MRTASPPNPGKPQRNTTPNVCKLPECPAPSVATMEEFNSNNCIHNHIAVQERIPQNRLDAYNSCIRLHRHSETIPQTPPLQPASLSCFQAQIDGHPTDGKCDSSHQENPIGIRHWVRDGMISTQQTAVVMQLQTTLFASCLQSSAKIT